MRVRIMSKMACIQHTYSDHVNPCIIVSINPCGRESRPKQAPRLTNHKNVLAVLPLFFDDIEPHHVEAGCELVLMRTSDGLAIKEFVMAWHDKVEEIIIHCHAGRSRSSAVACGVCLLLGMDDMPIWNDDYEPNHHVFDIMSKLVDLPAERVNHRHAVNAAFLEKLKLAEIEPQDKI